jgi:hypothetical protein
MKRISQHNVLLAGESFDHCSSQVRKFFDLTSLVIYDCIEINREKSVSGLDATFLTHIKNCENKNRKIVADLLVEIQESGISSIKDIGAIEQGYVSKTLHVLSHFLDGFIGIDSFFYSLHDDSHWLSIKTEQLINKEPDKYWLLHLDCYSSTPEEATILHM